MARAVLQVWVLSCAPHPPRLCACPFLHLAHPAAHLTGPPALQAIAVWRDNSDWGRCQLVKTYLAAVGGFGEPEVVKRVELPPGGAAAAGSGGPLERLQVWAEQLLGGGGQDPFYAVVAYKLQD